MSLIFDFVAICLVRSGRFVGRSAKAGWSWPATPKAINERNQADAKETARLFDRALLATTGQKTAIDSWKTLGLRPDDVVAIKINSDNWTIGLRPHPELVTALCLSLQTVIPANHIIVYDNDFRKYEREQLCRQRFRLRRALYRDRPGDGFDAQERLTKIITATATQNHQPGLPEMR